MSARISVAFIACLLSVPLMAQSPDRALDSAAWLAGCWEGGGDGREIHEQWMKPSGGTMLGMARTVAKGKTIEFEFTQIRLLDNGEVHYIAKPSGQPEASFKRINSGAQELIFENLDHDFPQRIRYRRNGDSALVARIEGRSKGQERAIDYPMRRVKCD